MENTQMLMVAKDRAILVKDNKACLVELDMKVLEQYDWTVTPTGCVITKKDGKYGLTKNGYEIVPPVYDEVSEKDGGRIAVRLGDKCLYGLIDSIGRKICEPKYELICNFHDGLAQVKCNGKWGVINQAGYEICEPKYDSIEFFGPYRTRYLLVTINGKKGLMNLVGSYVIKPQYESISGYIFNSDWLEVKLDGKRGLIDYNGQEILPIRFDWITQNDDHTFLVRVDGKYGLVNFYGEKVSEFKYDGSHSRCFGFIVVELNDKFGVVDEKFHEICPPKYDEVLLCNTSLFAVRLGSKWSFFDASGKQVSKIKYRRVHGFNNEYTYAIRYWSLRPCKINKTGKEVRMSCDERESVVDFFES